MDQELIFDCALTSMDLLKSIENWNVLQLSDRAESLPLDRDLDKQMRNTQTLFTDYGDDSEVKIYRNSVVGKEEHCWQVIVVKHW